MFRCSSCTNPTPNPTYLGGVWGCLDGAVQNGRGSECQKWLNFFATGRMSNACCWGRVGTVGRGTGLGDGDEWGRYSSRCTQQYIHTEAYVRASRQDVNNGEFRDGTWCLYVWPGWVQREACRERCPTTTSQQQQSTGSGCCPAPGKINMNLAYGSARLSR